jgi:DNA-binding GntR family transcriptional regulator
VAEITKYYGVRLQIENMLESGELAIGSRLPPELELAERFGVSRGTIRQALDQLVRAGVISRRSGSGTFVLRERIAGPESPGAALPQPSTAVGEHLSSRSVSGKRIWASEASDSFRDALALDAVSAAKMPVYCVEQLCYVGDRPVSRQTVYLPLADQFGRTLREPANPDNTLSDPHLFSYRSPARTDEIIHARPPTADEIDLLEMRAVPECERLVYERTRVTYDKDNRVLEVRIAVDHTQLIRSYRYESIAGYRVERAGADSERKGGGSDMGVCRGQPVAP